MSKFQRKLGNVFSSAKDAISEIINTIIMAAKNMGPLKSISSGTNQVDKLKEESVTTITGNSYEPIWERYIGKNVIVEGKSAANEQDMPMWHNLRQKYGSGSSTPPSNAGAPIGAGNTPNGVPPDYQWYLPSILASAGDYEWDRLDKTGLDLVSTGNNYFQTPSNPNPLQSYYGIYDRAIKKKLEKMKSPNVMVG